MSGMLGCIDRPMRAARKRHLQGRWGWRLPVRANMAPRRLRGRCSTPLETRGRGGDIDAALVLFWSTMSLMTGLDRYSGEPCRKPICRVRMNRLQIEALQTVGIVRPDAVFHQI